MKITIFLPEKTFSEEQISKLHQLGNVLFSPVDGEMKIEDCIALAKESDILGFDPDNFGGFDNARERLTKVMEFCPKLIGVVLCTTSFGWIDLDYCKKRQISVSNVPGYSRESVAEHTITLLLCMAKRVIITDRKTQKGAYAKEMGFELAGKTLGIIGLGNIGSRTAEIAQGIGMNVIAFNHSPKNVPGVTIVPLYELLEKSDAIAIHITHTDANHEFIGKEELNKVKPGVIIVNTADEGAIDEEAMAEALKSGKVDMYTSEGTLFENTPLASMERAIGVKGFGYYTKEAINNLFEIFVENIISLAKNKPKNIIK
jgi:lactate dehydrogenase-like 2-hydroxyacid dehydrogenase